jgi:hypothetical protein
MTQIFVRPQIGPPFAITIGHDLKGTSIHDVKLEIEAKSGVPPDRQRLIFSGRQPRDELKLGDDNIQKEATLYLSTRDGPLGVRSGVRNAVVSEEYEKYRNKLKENIRKVVYTRRSG